MTTPFNSNPNNTSSTRAGPSLLLAINTSTCKGSPSNSSTRSASFGSRSIGGGLSGSDGSACAPCGEPGCTPCTVCTWDLSAGAISFRMSSTLSTSLAPCLINSCGPRLRLAVMLPGTAKTSRFCSRAHWAVISEPLFSAASITTVPRLRPLMTRLRYGKWPASGWLPKGNSEITAPF